MNPYEPPQSSLEQIPDHQETLPPVETPPAMTWLTILKIIGACGLVWVETGLGIMLLERLLRAVGFLSSSELDQIDEFLPYFIAVFCGIGLFLWWWGRNASDEDQSSSARKHAHESL